MYRNTKHKGNIGEAYVLAKFVEYGFPVYMPYGDNDRADLVVEFNGKLQRVQVKTSTCIKNGGVRFDLVSSTMHRKNGVKRPYTKEEVDYYALYSIDRKKIYLISRSENDAQSILIRFDDPKNNNSKNCNFESDCLIDNVLKDFLP